MSLITANFSVGNLWFSVDWHVGYFLPLAIWGPKLFHMWIHPLLGPQRPCHSYGRWDRGPVDGTGALQLPLPGSGPSPSPSTVWYDTDRGSCLSWHKSWVCDCFMEQISTLDPSSYFYPFLHWLNYPLFTMVWRLSCPYLQLDFHEVYFGRWVLRHLKRQQIIKQIYSKSWHLTYNK